MTNRKSTKRALLGSVVAMVLCLAMLIGATFAWFTDTASTGVNKIQAGNLDIEIQDETGKAIDTLAWATKDGTAFAEDGKTPLWEPGCTYTLTPFQIVNKGNLALKYKIVVTGLEGDTGLLKVIKFTYKTGEETFDMNTEGHLAANGGASKVITVSAHMDEAAGNEYMNKTLEGVKFTVYATQDTVESDSFNNTYDANATYPVVNVTELKEALTNGGVVNVATDIRTNNSEDTAAARIVISQPTTLNLEKKIITPDDMGNNNSNFVALYVNADTTINAGKDGGIDTGVNGGYGINVQEGANLPINGGGFFGGGGGFGPVPLTTPGCGPGQRGGLSPPPPPKRLPCVPRGRTAVRRSACPAAKRGCAVRTSGSSAPEKSRARCSRSAVKRKSSSLENWTGSDFC